MPMLSSGGTMSASSGPRKYSTSAWLTLNSAPISNSTGQVSRTPRQPSSTAISRVGTNSVESWMIAIIISDMSASATPPCWAPTSTGMPIAP